MLFVDLAIQGVVQGAIYALIALGLTLIYGLLRILHVAHAALFTLGGYIGVLVTNQTGSFALGLVLAMLLVGALGVGIYRFAYKPLLSQPPLVSLIASIGMLIIAEELYRIIIWGLRDILFRPTLTDSARGASRGSLISCASSCRWICSFVSGHSRVVVELTRTGIAWRATVTDPDMAQSFGVNIEKVRYLNFFIGSALAAAAGVMVALLNNLVEPTMGAVPAYKGLAIIVLGGLGSVRGTLLASFALGVIESFGTIYLGHLLDRDAIAFAFLIVVLMFRPNGLLGRT